MLKDCGQVSKETKVCLIGLFDDGSGGPSNKMRCHTFNAPPPGFWSDANPLDAQGRCPAGYTLIMNPADCG